MKRLFSKLFTSPFKPLYDEARLEPDIRRSLMFIVFGNVFGNLFGVVTNGTALTGYAGELGANDFVFGLLTGIPLAATLLQIPFSSLVSRTQKRKLYMLTYGVVSRVLWIVVGLVPYFMPMEPTWLRLWTVIFLIGISSCCGSAINVCWTPWLADLAPIKIRGRWLSNRDAINSVIGVVFGLIIAQLLDNVPGFPGYTIAFVIGGIFGVLDMVSFAFAKEVYSQPPVKVKFGAVLKRIVSDKPFFTFMIFWTAWCFTANISGPFINRYALGDMGLSFMAVTLCSQIASALVTVLVISKWGRLLDRYGSKPVLWISCLVAATTPALFIFATPGNVWPLLLHNVIGAAFWSASNLASTSMQLSYSPDDLRPSYVAVYSCVTSLLGAFLGVVSGGALLEGIRSVIVENNLMIAGQLADPYKIVFVISVITRLAIVIIFVPKMKNDEGYTVRSMVKEIIGELETKRALRKELRQRKKSAKPR